jgi:hypothetical protein
VRLFRGVARLTRTEKLFQKTFVHGSGLVGVLRGEYSLFQRNRFARV